MDAVGFVVMKGQIQAALTHVESGRITMLKVTRSMYALCG